LLLAFVLGAAAVGWWFLEGRLNPAAIEAAIGGRLKTMLSGVEAEGWRFVASTRLVPIVPFNLLTYALGLTRIPLSQYVPRRNSGNAGK